MPGTRPRMKARLVTGDDPFPQVREMAILRKDTDLVEAARRMQEKLAKRFSCGEKTSYPDVRIIGGADVAYSGDVGIAVIALMTFPGLQPEGHAVSIRPVLFPYIPGLFGFREVPLYIAAAEKLPLPDLLMVNGHGYAHPRRFGLACHIGALLGIPTIGIANRLLTGTPAQSGSPGDLFVPVMDGDEIIGMAVRTRAGQRPVFVSAGYRTDLPFAVRMALGTVRDGRIPVPLKEAHRLSRIYRRRFEGR